ncbi:MAG: UV DNA damage repair endonuclease UvsE, partial [Raoultibacter sp.]
NTLNWQEMFGERLAALGEKARRFGIRLSMHPGQYTVLNSPNETVVARAVEDLAYHNAFLDALDMDASNKIILHVGGVYNNKPEAIKRFIEAHDALPDTIKRRLVIENDDRLYTAENVLAISQASGAPVVFDILHHRINPGEGTSEHDLLNQARTTWHEADGKQKIHYSQQAVGKKPGSHSETIAIAEFLTFYQQLGEKATTTDIMLEVKDKDLSALKCIDCTTSKGTIATLERAWAHYKYSVLEHDPNAYQQIRNLLKDKQAYPAREFYQLVEDALAKPAEAGTFRNAVQHVWGYVSNLATEQERASFAKLMDRFEHGDATGATVKKRLATLAAKYNQTYLVDSYYFIL